MVSLTLGIIVLLTRLTHGFITCKCDTAECHAMNGECKAELYCYVAFRLAKPSDRKVSPKSKWMYGAGSQLFVAEHRGCVTPDELQMCREHPARGGGDFESLDVDEEGREHLPIIQCCNENRCNVGQEVEFTRAELDGRQFFLNPETSNLEPGLGLPIFSSKSSADNFGPQHFADLQDSIDRPFKKLKNTAAAGSASSTALSDRPHQKRPSYQWLSGTSLSSEDSPLLTSPSLILPSGYGLIANSRVSNFKGDDTSSWPNQVQAQPLQENEVVMTSEARSLPIIVIKPLHIAIGVCLIILTLVAVLLHVVIVLHRRHRRLKRELIKQTQKTSIVGHHNHQQQPSHHWPFVATSPMACQAGGQRIDLQQLKPPTVAPEMPKKCRGRLCGFSCTWKRTQTKPLPSNVCVHQAAATASDLQVRQYLPREPSIFTQTPVTYNELLTTSSPHHNTVPLIPTLPTSPAVTYQQRLQPVMYSSHVPEYSYRMNTITNAYGTGSSVSEGSGNNPSTTDSSLPTQSSAVTGWNNANNSVSLHNGHALTVHMTNLERPSLSGSSEGGGLVTPDFETRRANVALPPALLGEDRGGKSMFSSPINTFSLTVFRSAAQQNEVSSLVTPYAQLQLSLSHDQYDTPEQILDDDNVSNSHSTSLDGFGQIRIHDGSNPTTNSSLLQSYCERGGGASDIRV